MSYPRPPPGPPPGAPPGFMGGGPPGMPMGPPYGGDQYRGPMGPSTPMGDTAMYSPAPQPGQGFGGHQQQPYATGPQGGNPHAQVTTGTFEGARYEVDCRDTNSILRVQLQQGYTIKGKPGAMVFMDATIGIKGSMKLSFTKMVMGGEMSESQFTGPGEVALAPDCWGDILAIPVQPGTTWSVGKDAYLASTMGLTRSTKSQGFMKGMMSGEGFFVSRVEGSGILWVQSLGAIIKRDLAPGQQLIVDNGHLVAWSASYNMERISTSGGGMFSGSHTGEGAVCRFTGPGSIYIQTRNPESLGAWISAQIPRQGGY